MGLLFLKSSPQITLFIVFSQFTKSKFSECFLNVLFTVMLLNYNGFLDSRFRDKGWNKLSADLILLFLLELLHTSVVFYATPIVPEIRF